MQTKHRSSNYTVLYLHNLQAKIFYFYVYSIDNVIFPITNMDFLPIAYDRDQVALIRSDLKDRLTPEEKTFYVGSIADAGITNISKAGTQDIDKLLQFFASNEASPEYQANVFAAIESYLPDYLVSYLANSDYDNDGVTFAEELRLGTNPSIPDSPARSYRFVPVREIDDGMEL